MGLRRKGFLQPSTKKQENSGQLFAAKEGGQIGGMAGLFFTLFLGAMLCAVLRMEHYRAVSLYLEDALAASILRPRWWMCGSTVFPTVF